MLHFSDLSLPYHRGVKVLKRTSITYTNHAMTSDDNLCLQCFFRILTEGEVLIINLTECECAQAHVFLEHAVGQGPFKASYQSCVPWEHPMCMIVCSFRLSFQVSQHHTKVRGFHQ